MSLGRAWTRQLFGASGAALLVPGAIALALLALAVAGGFGQLSDLSQAFAGPAAPGGASVANIRAARAGRAILPVAPAAAARAVAGGGVKLAAAGGAKRGGVRTGGADPRAGLGPVETSGPGTGSSGTGSPGTGTGTGTGTGQPSGGSGSGQTIVDKVVGVGISVTSQLPGSLGTTATNVLQSVGKGVDSLLPAQGESSGPAQTVKTLLPGVGLP